MIEFGIVFVNKIRVFGYRFIERDKLADNLSAFSECFNDADLLDARLSDARFFSISNCFIKAKNIESLFW
jgi:hypothetical protein